jgi:hypothetical protein
LHASTTSGLALARDERHQLEANVCYPNNHHLLPNFAFAAVFLHDARGGFSL